MAEKLTNEQQAAVDSRERSLLVSAAAGSGKTKVLVERLFSYVEREGANLDDFLIITYTRAAASELRGKIAKALTERMERDPGNYHLRQQMLRVYRADIKTVDAFCTAQPPYLAAAAVDVALKVLNGEEIGAPVDLGVDGYTAMTFREGSTTVLEGEGWVVIDAENVDSFGF